MFFQQLVNGITIGSTYALVAIGYTMVFGVLELINFANGSLYMMGGYIALMVHLAMKGSFVWAFVVAILATGAVGFAIDRFGLRRLRAKKSPKLVGLITTLGMATIIDNSIMLLFGSETKSYPNVLDFGKLVIGSVIISWTQIIILLVCILMMAGLSIIVYKTKIGKAMRSTAQNADAARLMGVNVNRVISSTFIISSVLATVAGVLIGMYYHAIDTNVGASIGMKTFASAVLGGVGVLPGAMIGALLVGVIETLAASYISSGYRDAIAFAILILVLLIKPSGLLGKKQINKV